MRKTLGRTAVLAICLLVAGAAMAGTITGRGAGQPSVQTIFRIDTPAANATVFGIVDVTGYVLDSRGVSRITLLVDGSAVHDADINQPRVDVQRRYARFFGESFPYDPGFTTSFLASNYTAGPHTLAIRVTYSNSDVADLGTRTITVDTTTNEAPLGDIDSPHDPAVYGIQDTVSGPFPVVGWAIDDVGIRQRVSPAGCVPATDPTCHVLADIEVMVDNQVVGQAIYPLPRPDIANRYPDVPGAFQSGFQMNLDTTRFTNGGHTISVRAWDTAGMSAVIGSRDVFIDNNYATLGPFGKIDWPMANAHLFDTDCVGPGPSGVFTPGSRLEWVSGWVVDQNDQQRFQGVKYVELLLDGVTLASTSYSIPTFYPDPPFTQTNCFYSTIFSMNVNCYGYDRPDILYQYPQFAADAKNSGFFFILDVDYLLFQGIHQGLHYLAIRVGTQDPTRPAVIIDQIPVILECNPTGGLPSFGELEVPVAMQAMQGSPTVSGWVYDYSVLSKLNFYVDGVLDGSLTPPSSHLGIYRPDLIARYPFLGHLLDHTGFTYTLDTTKYVDGVHQLVIQTVDVGGYRNYWVQRPVVFDNANRP